MNIESMLHRSGIIQERAKRDGRSLDKTERVIISIAREMATKAGYSRQSQNFCEMDGQTNFKEVLTPIKVKARFAYYNQGYEDIPAFASFFVLESNHPSLPEKGNLSAEEFTEAGLDVPKHPTYEEWVRSGRPIFRGKL